MKSEVDKEELVAMAAVEEVAEEAKVFVVVVVGMRNHFLVSMFRLSEILLEPENLVSEPCLMALK